MMKSCTQCSAEFEVTDEDLALLKKLSPEIGGKTYELPVPAMCFDCRLQRRLAFYNCRKLYWRTCDATGKQTLSTYSESKPFTIYHKDYWWSDDWNPLDYGRDVDLTKPVFPQIRALMETVPQQAYSKLGSDENSDYANDSYKLKNCYLVFDGEEAENAYYGHSFVSVKDCLDFLSVQNSELCYECTHCRKSYNLMFSRFCLNCSDSWFLRDCISCKNCFGCANLRQKQYCIFNEQKTPEEFKSFMQQFQSSKHSVLKKIKADTEKFLITHPVKEHRGDQNIDSVGDNIFQCKDCYNCYDCVEAQDCRHCSNLLAPGSKDCLDVHIWGDKMEKVYNSALIGAQAKNIISGYYNLLGCDSLYYSQWCSRNCKNLFGCIGLRQSEYCIFNKQYSKEDYELLLGKVFDHMIQTGEWGQFYPPEISAFGYNETMAQTFMPMNKEQVLQKGWQWSDDEVTVQAEKSIPAKNLPDDTSDIPDDVLNWALLCEVSGKPYKIIAKELEFYRKHELPIPRRHPDVRHQDRFELKNPYKLWSRSCAKCSKSIQTTYAPDRPEIVYCEECYLKEVY